MNLMDRIEWPWHLAIIALIIILLVIGLVFVSHPLKSVDILKDAKVIYKLVGDRYEQITDISQIKEGVYIVIR